MNQPVKLSYSPTPPYEEEMTKKVCMNYVLLFNWGVGKKEEIKKDESRRLSHESHEAQSFPAPARVTTPFLVQGPHR